MSEVVFTTETVDYVVSARCEVCDLDTDELPVEMWAQWTRNHLALHEPGAAVIVWTYRHYAIWRMEQD
jgi:hypothetical protein